MRQIGTIRAENRLIFERRFWTVNHKDLSSPANLIHCGLRGVGLQRNSPVSGRCPVPIRAHHARFCGAVQPKRAPPCFNGFECPNRVVKSPVRFRAWKEDTGHSDRSAPGVRSEWRLWHAEPTTAIINLRCLETSVRQPFRVVEHRLQESATGASQQVVLLQVSQVLPI